MQTRQVPPLTNVSFESLRTETLRRFTASLDKEPKTAVKTQRRYIGALHNSKVDLKEIGSKDKDLD